MPRNNYISKKYLIVDGYNVINAWGSLDTDDLEKSRETLVGYILEYSKMKGFEAYVVFDAYNVKNKDKRTYDYHGVKVVFTKENQTADSYIEIFISQLSKYDEVAVVTSDYAEQQIVLGKGCSRVPARELIDDLENLKKSLRKKNSSIAKKCNTMNRLENKIDQDIFWKLEKIRRRR